MYISPEVAEILRQACALAENARYEYVTPELVLYAACRNKVFAQAFQNCDGSVKKLDFQLKSWLEENMEKMPAEEGKETSETSSELSQGFIFMMTCAWEAAQNSEKPAVELPHILHAMYRLPESYAVYFMQLQGVEQDRLLREMTIAAGEASAAKSTGRRSAGQTGGRREKAPKAPAELQPNHNQPENPDGDNSLPEDSNYGDFPYGPLPEEEDAYEEDTCFWRQFASCLNEELENVNPLIGRQEELERTMQILCRREKNNPLHIGEPGVGKTAITCGLARLLEEGKVPAPLSGARIYALDLGSLLAGTQYRGDFEKRFKRVMEDLSQEEKPIIYIDEIHNIVGAGAVNGGTFDVSNMLKPYLAAGHIRFIGATTYEEYKKHFAKNKSLVRRFQNIDIKEPGVQDTVLILEGLRETYEAFHGVTYEDGVLEYAVEMSAKYINERYLPDKAIDLIDEAGAYRRMHPIVQKQPPTDGNSACQHTQTPGQTQQPADESTAYQHTQAPGQTQQPADESTACQHTQAPGQTQQPADESTAYQHTQTPGQTQQSADEAHTCPHMSPFEQGETQTPQIVDKALIDEILSKTCQIPKQMVENDETQRLGTLENRLLSRIFGQNEAVSQVVNAVKFARAGLLEDGKPLASLLFVGPTGVGKTEIARSLAEELGIRLIRFDMSEYEEKHAVAKLIGAPAGYVGYEEGGLLTEEIRKSPHAVLLLDEIEKAHPDIYNILLQAMDYATLTDNQGRKADFRNVIIIMTSNAGASRIGKHGIGFQGKDVSSDILLEEVKRTFQPEFRNRLSRIVVFNSMDDKMAEQIVEKKLGGLQKMLLRKNVELSADAPAKQLIKQKGISAEFGAREIERVIRGEVKPLLVDEILFGALKDGGRCCLTAENNSFRLELTPDG